MTGHGAKFARKKEDAIIALLNHRSIDEAAKSVGISGKTLLRWMKEPEFDTAYRNARRAAFSQSIARLQQMSGAAAATLGKLMVDPSTPASTRARVADSILDHAAKAIEIEDIEVRVRALERKKWRPYHRKLLQHRPPRRVSVDVAENTNTSCPLPDGTVCGRLSHGRDLAQGQKPHNC